MASELNQTERILIAALTKLNYDLGIFALRALDAHAGKAEPTSVEEEWQIGCRLVEMGQVLQARATERTEPAEVKADEDMQREGSGDCSG